MKKLLVDVFTTKIACPTGSFRVLAYPSGVDVSTSTLRYLSACLRTRRRAAGTQRPDALYADRGALLHWFRRLRIRWEIRDDIHEAFLRFACAIICWRRLHNISNC